ncbi:MAG: zinc ABC transporter substrate-binding protein [Pseudomonadota bacterium]
MTKKILQIITWGLFNIAICAQAQPLVLSSIKPLTLIAQEIARDCATVDTLLPESASPHNYPLKVSDHSRLQKADVVLWVGPELESFLQKPLSNLPTSQRITAYELSGLYWPAEKPHANNEHHHDRDPHLWLNPRNAIVIAQALSEKLAAIDEKNKLTYIANLQTFKVKMTQLDMALTAKLKPFAKRGFAVYHEGYSHFVSHYGLYQLNYVTFTPEQKPGAKHLHQLRKILSKEGRCLLLEPYYEQQSMRDLAKELNLKLGILDALGSQNVNSYEQLLERMADAFSHCLANGDSAGSM